MSTVAGVVSELDVVTRVDLGERKKARRARSGQVRSTRRLSRSLVFFEGKSLLTARQSEESRRK